MQKESKIKICIWGIYFFLIVGIVSPIIIIGTDFFSDYSYLLPIIPAISSLLVNRLQKSAFSTVQNRAFYAQKGVRELRIKYQKHIIRLENAALILQIYAVIASLPLLNVLVGLF